jgi:hypothetical protein
VPAAASPQKPWLRAFIMQRQTVTKVDNLFLPTMTIPGLSMVVENWH